MFLLETLDASYDPVLLKNPDLGNVYDIDLNTTTRRTRNGELKIVYDDGRPSDKTKTYSFTALRKTDLDALVTFLTSTLGIRIQLTDYNGATYTGIVLTETLEITTRRDTHSYDVSFSVIVYSVTDTAYYLTTEDGVLLTTEDDVQLVTERDS